MKKNHQNTVSTVSVQRQWRAPHQDSTADPHGGAMPHRTAEPVRFCALVDLLSITALVVAGIALLSILLGTAVANEALLFWIFHKALMAAVAGFLVARCIQIARILWHDLNAKEYEAPGKNIGANVEMQAEQERLGRAA